MNYFLTLDCRGTHIKIDSSIIGESKELKVYWDRASSGKFGESELTPFFVNCTAETMHKVLDLVPAGHTDDEQVLKIADYLGFDITPLPEPKFSELELNAIAQNFVVLLSSFGAKDRDRFTWAIVEDLQRMKETYNVKEGTDKTKRLYSKLSSLFTNVGQFLQEQRFKDPDPSNVVYSIQCPEVAVLIRDYLNKCPEIRMPMKRQYEGGVYSLN